MPPTSNFFSELLHTIQKLLGENGCPWDKRQTNVSLRKHLISEMDELIHAIDIGDHENICEELGDLMYLILLVSEINAKDSLFTLDNVLQTVNRKLIRRHPHVFAEVTVLNEKELRAQWLAIKAREKSEKLN